MSEPPSVFYVNDGSLSNDVWCTAPGSAANTGLDSGSPLASLHDVIDRYQPTLGATVYVDAGYYGITRDWVLPDTGAGSLESNLWFHVIGTGPNTVIERLQGNATSAVLRVNQDFTQVEGLVLRGAVTGILVDPTTCRNAILNGNILTGSSGFGVTVLPDPVDAGTDTYVIRNNLLFGNGGGMNLQGNTGYHRAGFHAFNNTVVVYGGHGLVCGGAPQATTLENNIVSVKGSGYCLVVSTNSPLLASNHNNLHAYSGASVARGPIAGTLQTAAALSDWQKSGFDLASLGSDPLFVNPSTGDFHVRSVGGTWNGTAWRYDTVTSPCVDAGNPSSAYSTEPVPNGGRVNLGAYGNTVQASRSVANRVLTWLAPAAGDWSGTLTLVWNASGASWQTTDTVRLEAYTASTGWTSIAGASALSPSGSWEWPVLQPEDTTASYRLRAVCNQDSTVVALSGIGWVTRVPTTYYVNDSSTEGDLYCTVPGLETFDGLTPETPLPSLAAVLSRHALQAGDTVRIDTGTYASASNTVVAATHRGVAGNPVRIEGTGDGTVLTHTGGGTDRRVLDIRADHIRLEGLTCTGGEVGLFVDAGSSRHAQLVGNACKDNTSHGIVVKPLGTLSGEEYQILQNVVVGNGAGLYLQGSPGMADAKALFVVENNTIRNTGTGIALAHGNNAGRRTNLLKNNIVEVTGTAGACVAALPNAIHYSDFNNLHAPGGAAIGAWLAADGVQLLTLFPSLSQWQTASGQELHSLSADSLFQAPAEGDYRLQAGSPCVDAGVISYWMFDAEDAEGGPRIAGSSVDIGAYEINARATIRLFLQGAYPSGSPSMTTALSTAGLLPAKSPYADDPRTAVTIPDNVTDWVLLQFRLSPTGPSVLSRSVFLRNDGWLIDEQGNTDLGLGLPLDAAYYVVAKHRNHLAVMSPTALAYEDRLLHHDFTAGPSAYYGGTLACTGIASTNGTVWALRAGDADGNGRVQEADLAIYLSSPYASGYRRADAGLAGTLSATSGILIQQNLGAASTLPSPEVATFPMLRISPSRQTVDPESQTILTGIPETSSLSDSTTTLTNPYDGTSGTATGATSNELDWAFAQWTDGSGATLVASNGLQATYTAGPITGRTDVVEAWDSQDALGRAFLNVIGSDAATSAGQAVVIAGRTSDQDTLWPATDYLADIAYSTLRYRGFAKENLHYLSPEPDVDVDGNGLLDDIDGEATFDEAAHTFTNAVSGTDRLFVYLVDHGGNTSGNGYFRLNGTETITATQLDAWLDDLQDTSQTHVTVLLDFCYAGSFLPALAYTGTATRIVIAACGDDQPSYFVASGLVSFSGAFFSGVMLGYDVLENFNMASNAMAMYQSALLDDDKDGQATSGDGTQATGTFIGPTYVASGETPQIGAVCGNQVLTDTTSATLWIGSVSSAHPIQKAWALVIPPGHNPDPDNPVTELPTLDLTYDTASGRYTVSYDAFTSPGTYNVTFYVQDGEGNVSTPRSAYVAQIGYDDRVILVAAGDTNSVAWPAIDDLSALAYDTFSLRLFPKDHIRVLAPDPDRDFDGDSQPDVADTPSLASLQTAIAEWATTNSTDRLTLYILGQASGDALPLNPAENLTTNVLASWVQEFQATNPVPVTVILDFAGSGAFIPALEDVDLATESPDATRIVLASARSGHEALFANGGAVSYSQYLLSGVIAGETLGDAHTAARRCIRRISGGTRQQAQLDDNLNGEPNEKDIDGLLADTVYLGSAFVTGADAPVIGSVLPKTVLETPGDAVTLWAAEVAAMHPISNVWCVVTPPGYSGSEDLPTLALAWNATTNRYEVSCTDFVLPGAYGLTFLAEDTQGVLSAPVQSEIILADAYEPDNSADAASTYFGTAQLHTLHVATDEDWTRVYLATNFVYDIETYPFSVALDTVLELYREGPDGTLDLIDHVDDEGSEFGEYTGLDYPEAGWYWVRVSAFPEGTNTLGSYELSIDIPAAAGLNNLIVLGVDDVHLSALPVGAYAFVSGQSNKTFSGLKNVVFTGLTNGTYLVTVPVPEHFIPREDPDYPNQVGSLTNLFYANPRQVAVSGGWAMAGFEFFSTLTVTSGVVRDAWTKAYLDGAQPAFTAASGSLAGIEVDGEAMLTNYRTPWVSVGGGQLPADMPLGACNWDLDLSLSGYQTLSVPGAISNLTTGSHANLGTLYLTPVDTNANQVADTWEGLYFPGGMDPDMDSDGDGIDNRAEYLCGTDPTNSLSVLKFLGASLDAEGTMELEWTASSGRGYQVLCVTSLVDAAAVATNGPWEASPEQTTMTWSDLGASGQPARFYRIRLDTP